MAALSLATLGWQTSEMQAFLSNFTAYAMAWEYCYDPRIKEADINTSPLAMMCIESATAFLGDTVNQQYREAMGRPEWRDSLSIFMSQYDLWFNLEKIEKEDPSRVGKFEEWRRAWHEKFVARAKRFPGTICITNNEKLYLKQVPYSYLSCYMPHLYPSFDANDVTKSSPFNYVVPGVYQFEPHGDNELPKFIQHLVETVRYNRLINMRHNVVCNRNVWEEPKELQDIFFLQWTIDTPNGAFPSNTAKAGTLAFGYLPVPNTEPKHFAWQFFGAWVTSTTTGNVVQIHRAERRMWDNKEERDTRLIQMFGVNANPTVFWQFNYSLYVTQRRWIAIAVEMEKRIHQLITYENQASEVPNYLSIQGSETLTAWRVSSMARDLMFYEDENVNYKMLIIDVPPKPIFGARLHNNELQSQGEATCTLYAEVLGWMMISTPRLKPEALVPFKRTKLPNNDYTCNWEDVMSSVRLGERDVITQTVVTPNNVFKCVPLIDMLIEARKQGTPGYSGGNYSASESFPEYIRTAIGINLGTGPLDKNNFLGLKPIVLVGPRSIGMQRVNFLSVNEKPYKLTGPANSTRFYDDISTNTLIENFGAPVKKPRVRAKMDIWSQTEFTIDEYGNKTSCLPRIEYITPLAEVAAYMNTSPITRRADGTQMPCFILLAMGTVHTMCLFREPGRDSRWTFFDSSPNSVYEETKDRCLFTQFTNLHDLNAFFWSYIGSITFINIYMLATDAAYVASQMPLKATAGFDDMDYADVLPFGDVG